MPMLIYRACPQSQCVKNIKQQHWHWDGTFPISALAEHFNPHKEIASQYSNSASPFIYSQCIILKSHVGHLRTTPFGKWLRIKQTIDPLSFNMYFGVHCLDIKIHKVNGTNLTQWKPSQDLRNFDDYDSQTPWQWNLTSRWHLHKIMDVYGFVRRASDTFTRKQWSLCKRDFWIVAEDYGNYTIGNIYIYILCTAIRYTTLNFSGVTNKQLSYII